MLLLATCKLAAAVVPSCIVMPPPCDVGTHIRRRKLHSRDRSITPKASSPPRVTSAATAAGSGRDGSVQVIELCAAMLVKVAGNLAKNISNVGRPWQDSKGQEGPTLALRKRNSYMDSTRTVLTNRAVA